MLARPTPGLRPPQRRARLFLALEPAEEARAEVAAWRDALVAGRDDLRPVAAEALHLTLVFLGWQDERDVERIAATMAPTAAAAPRLTPGAVKPIPPRAPRLFALDLEDEEGRAGAIQTGLSASLQQVGLYEPERRPFWPHMTLARVRRGRRAEALEPSTLPGAFEAPLLTLYRSTLRPQGARYEPLHRIRLG